MVSATDAAAHLDYDRLAAEYARHRRIHPGVLHEIIASGRLGPERRLLDVGCGTGNYAAALVEATGCRVAGIDPARAMLERARGAVQWESLGQGTAERLPFAGDSFDLVMSTDVIHHVRNRDAYFREAARVLRPGGQIVTVTDSHDDIRRRRPLSSHFPQTVDIELRRYPAAPLILEEMARAGFTASRVVAVALDYDLTDLQPYRDRVFSSLLLIDETAYQHGITRLEADLARGPIPCVSLYTLIWGASPRA